MRHLGTMILTGAMLLAPTFVFGQNGAEPAAAVDETGEPATAQRSTTLSFCELVLVSCNTPITFSVPPGPADDAAIAEAQSGQTGSAGGTQGQAAPANADDPAAEKAPLPQPKRILGVMPNFRAVSAGTRPPPPSPKEALIIATKNSFDYSSFVFVGITSALAEWSDAHQQLGEGFAGYGRYYWRGLLDKTDGNYWVIFVLPTFLHEDERYYAMGRGGFWKRALYSSTRVLITPNYNGNNTFNASEIFGRGISQLISLEYYPVGDRTIGALADKYGWAIGRDVLTNVFREFWPDIATHVLHRHP